MCLAKLAVKLQLVFNLYLLILLLFIFLVGLQKKLLDNRVAPKHAQQDHETDELATHVNQVANVEANLVDSPFFLCILEF